MRSRDDILRYWLEHDLFSFQWWFLVISTLLSWGVWAWLVNRRRLPEIVMFGLMVSLAATYLDSVLSGLVLWAYPHMELPIMYPAAWVNFGPLPVTFMLVYQWCRTWRKFMVVSVGVSAVIAYLIEPLEVWLKIYQLYSWRYTYSFVIYLLMFVGFRWLLERIQAAAKV